MKYYKTLEKILKENGCYYVRPGKGSHETWFSPITNIHFTFVRGNNKKFTSNNILKQAGIDYKF